MYKELEIINSRPEPFEYYTASDLWTDEHTSAMMLSYHLNGDIDVSSRNTAFIDKSVAWMVSHFNIGTGIKIADFGCGPGLYTAKLASRKADVTGIDFSTRSIQYARESAAKANLNIRYVDQNYLDYDTDERYNLILMIMCDFCALSPDQRETMLNKFHNLLAPGGSVILDVYSLSAFEQREETATYELNQLNGFWSPDRYYGFQNTFKYEGQNVVLDKYTIMEENRTRIVYNWLQYFSPEFLIREFEVCGFSVDELFSDVAGASFDPESHEFAVVARKKA